MEGPHVPESDLVERAQRGDSTSFGILVERYQEIAFRTAYVICGSHADAADATQDALVKAWSALDRFRLGAPFRPWLLRIVANEAKNRRRSGGRSARLALEIAHQPTESGIEPSAEGAVLVAERRAVLLEAVKDLREEDRLVLVCRYFLQLSEEETAAALDTRKGTVKSRTSRALERLRTKIEETGDA